MLCYVEGVGHIRNGGFTVQRGGVGSLTKERGLIENWSQQPHHSHLTPDVMHPEMLSCIEGVGGLIRNRGFTILGGGGGGLNREIERKVLFKTGVRNLTILI